MRLPVPMNVKKIRGRFGRARRALHEQRQVYLAKCWNLCQHLKGTKLFQAVIEVADKMVDAGLYSMAKNQVRFAVLRWFARQEENTNIIDLGFWERWLDRRRINLTELRVA